MIPLRKGQYINVEESSVKKKERDNLKESIWYI